VPWYDVDYVRERKHQTDHRDGTLGKKKTLVIGFWGGGALGGDKNEDVLGPTPVKSRRSITSAWVEFFLPERLADLDFSGTGGTGVES
jgi:hypothetical protein